MMSCPFAVSLDELRNHGVGVSRHCVGELQQLAKCFADKPHVHIVEADGSEVTIPVSELEQLVQTISHLQAEQEIIAFYLPRAGRCIFQYPDSAGDLRVFRIKNQLHFKASSCQS